MMSLIKRGRVWAAVLLFAVVFIPVSSLAIMSIDQNTVWSGKVLVAEDTMVVAGVTLLVQPGTEIRFARQKSPDAAPLRLIVAGKLIAQGTAAAPILFSSAAENPASGDWSGLIFENNVETVISRLSHSRIEYAETAISGTLAALVVENCRLQHNKTAVLGQKKFTGGMFNCDVVDNEIGVVFSQSSGFRLENCRIVRNGSDGVFCTLNSSPQIANCQISDNRKAGIRCLLGASPQIHNCLVSGNQTGIHIEMKSHPQLQGNDILGNQTGIHAEKLVAPLISSNRIADNEIGITCNYSGYPLIRENNFDNNRRFAIVLGDNQSRVVDRLLPAAKNRKLMLDETSLPADPQILAEERIAEVEDRELIFDARENWWGELPGKQMAAIAKGANLDIFEDFFDKPDSEYLDKKYPRDQVVFDPWAPQPYADAGRKPKLYSTISGKVVMAGKPLAGARVHVFRDAGDDLHGEGFVFSAPTDADGLFFLNLAPGRYYLVAKKTAAGFPETNPAVQDVFGYYGGNPVAVEPESDVRVNLQAVSVRPIRLADSSEPGLTVIEGRVQGADGPVAGVRVYLYPDASSGFRGPDLFGPQGAVPGGTDDDGFFAVDVPPGRYYLVATRRHDGQLGPLRIGDQFGFLATNPLTVTEGQTAKVAMDVVEKLKDQQEIPRFGSLLASIRGVIKDASGVVHPEIYAFAFTEPYPVGTIPPFRSLPVNAAGEFLLPVAGPGTYYIGARSGYGGPPLPGEWHSFHGDAMMLKVEVGPDGPPEALEIIVRQME